MSEQPTIYRIPSPKQNKKGEGTAIVLASDWHADELVPAHKVNGLNRFNPSIAERRAKKFFELTVRFIRVDRQEMNIDRLVLWLGGDFITSSEMHDAECAYRAGKAIMVAKSLLVSGIRYIREQEPDLKIHIVGSVGNHSRMSGSHQKVNQATEQERSLEWMMYHSIQEYFETDKHVSFSLQNSYNSYIKLYNKVIRFNHGHLGWRYNNGLAGIHGPVWRAIKVWDDQVKADLTCFGHYHTYTPASPNRPYLSNGSLIGLTAYSLNFGKEDPIQAYFIFHSKHGTINQRPLFVDD